MQTMIANTNGNDGRLTLRVEEITTVAQDIIQFRLQEENGAQLPSWQPGAHIDVVVSTGVIRQYSLCGDPLDRTSYVFAVLRQPMGRGGSEHLHSATEVGSLLQVGPPRNLFPLREAPDYLFLAGGVGITPILSMVRYVANADMPWRLVYGAKDMASMAFLPDLTAISSSGDLAIVPEDRLGIPDFRAAISEAAPGAAIYACGPVPMLTAVQAICEELGVADRLSFEKFATEPLALDETPFEIELASTGQIIPVPSNMTALEALMPHRPDIMYSCEQGYCGTCQQDVLAGTVDHRDTVLSDDERKTGQYMVICVSRASCPRVILDL